MNFKYLSRSLAAIAVLALASCKPELADVSPEKGSADFSRYIAVGNSLTAGFADGGLYLDGQKNSYPEIIGAQLKTVGGGAFSTPFFNAAQANGSGYKKLQGFAANGNPVIGDVAPGAETGSVTIPGVGTVRTLAKYSGEINNYGVPGIKLIHAGVAAYGNANPYYERLLTGNIGTHNTAYLDFATAKPYTFFSCWLGNNDILGYASGGGVGDSPTDKGTFTAAYTAAIARLTANGAKGVVATIPDVTTTPYFRTVTTAILLATVKANAPQVTALYIATNGGPRAATAEDLFILPFSSLAPTMLGKPNGLGIPYGLHPGNPIESKYVLDKDEVATVTDFTNAYNQSIKTIAASKNLAVMDAGAVLNAYAAGKVVNGVTISSAFITGNLFSLDGIHLTPMGYALTASEFIKAINKQYGSSVPTPDVTKFRGVLFP
ncbi:G-D-S-L family lipolytic protein [Pedobacter yulinensis]|uniref:G-D-S-L family lipolytic protein n=1 Tax=Pedobacter yulinensis TaxID=2126353 RepID=A0A2T3HNZ0_9SPHI|nr:SGNH/GDSL hydrolase family protein [Pedobacter yulinensis]PST84170.1 G-D-S-L family lipolytic protein [Pedobacter yulinensis]